MDIMNLKTTEKKQVKKLSNNIIGKLLKLNKTKITILVIYIITTFLLGNYYLIINLINLF